LDRHHAEEELQQRPYISQHPQVPRGETQNTHIASQEIKFNSSLYKYRDAVELKNLNKSHARPRKPKSKVTRNKISYPKKNVVKNIATTYIHA
jgi:hypothetical protein